MSDIKFYRDEDGAPRAEAENPHLSALAQFLESDIQDDTEICEELVETVTELPGNSEEPLEVVGNSYSVTFDGETVTFDCLPCESDDIFTLPADTVRAELQRWLEFIR